jgi:hypothetical protein
MTPKEKAKELYDAYEKIFIDANADSWGKEATACAILHCQGIIDEINVIGESNYAGICQWKSNGINYWEQVLNEIQSL